MGVMRAVGTGHRLPAHAKVRADAHEYVIELDVSDFLESELHVELRRARASPCAATSCKIQGTTGSRSACTSGSRSRFGFPTTSTPTGSRSCYRHGTLEIRAPRSRLEPRTVPIEHRSPYVGSPDAVPC